MQGQDGIDFGLLGELLDVDLVEGIGSQYDVLEFASFVHRVEEEAFEEGSVGLFDDSVYDVDIILNLPVASGRVILVADLSLINVWIPKYQSPLRLSFNNLSLEGPLYFLDIRILKCNIVILQVLALAVSMSILHVDLALPKLH